MTICSRGIDQAYYTASLNRRAEQECVRQTQGILIPSVEKNCNWERGNAGSNPVGCL